MKFICVYTDLINQGLTYKAEIECDHIEVMDTADFGSEQMLIAFVKDDNAVFVMHESRVIEAYAENAVKIQQVDKKILNTKRANPKNLSLLQD